jgi:hypothetical protein
VPSWNLSERNRDTFLPNHNICSPKYTKLANVNVVAIRKSLKIRTTRKTESVRKKEATCISVYRSHHARFQKLEDAVRANGNSRSIQSQNEEG